VNAMLSMLQFADDVDRSGTSHEGFDIGLDKTFASKVGMALLANENRFTRQHKLSSCFVDLLSHQYPVLFGCINHPLSAVNYTNSGDFNASIRFMGSGDDSCHHDPENPKNTINNTGFEIQRVSFTGKGLLVFRTAQAYQAIAPLLNIVSIPRVANPKIDIGCSRKGALKNSTAKPASFPK
jgi:hypothetical protein